MKREKDRRKIKSKNSDLYYLCINIFFLFGPYQENILAHTISQQRAIARKNLFLHAVGKKNFCPHGNVDGLGETKYTPTGPKRKCYTKKFPREKIKVVNGKPGTFINCASGGKGKG